MIAWQRPNAPENARRPTPLGGPRKLLLESWEDLESTVTSMFTQLDQVKRIEPQIGTGREWWMNFRNAIQLRRRMTRPRLPADLALSREDILTIVRCGLRISALLQDILRFRGVLTYAPSLTPIGRPLGGPTMAKC